MAGQKLRLAVVGLGRVATSHFEAIGEIGDLVELAAVMSRDEAKGRQAAARHGASKVYTEYEAMLEDREIDAVILCLPHFLHASATIAAARAGKHVLCEKPMALNADEARQMIRAAEEHGVFLMIGQSRRFYDAVLESKRIAQSGRLGRLIAINEWNYSLRLEDHPSTWRPDLQKSGGRIMPFWGVHLLDYILWMFDARPTTVAARMASVNPNWDGEDEAIVLLGFDGGGMASIHLSWNARIRPTHSRQEVTGRIWNSKKNAVYERYVIGEKGALYMNDETDLCLDGEPVVSGPQRPSNFALQLREFASAIAEGREPLASGREVMKVQETVDAAFRAARENCTVTL
jgi:predicted dehydrogenase